MRLNLGAGGQRFEGFLRVDLHGDADLRFDISKAPWPLDDTSVSEIISFHTFEHISFRDEETLWRETYRVLEPGGRLLVETPDAAAIMEIFLRGDRRFNFEMTDLLGVSASWGEPMRFLLGYQKGEGQDHRSFYTFEKFGAIAHILGFSDATTRHIFTGNMPCLRFEATK